jgi:hypothetical protein
MTLQKITKFFTVAQRLYQHKLKISFHWFEVTFNGMTSILELMEMYK